MRLAVAVLRWFFWVEAALFLIGSFGLPSGIPRWWVATGVLWGTPALVAAFAMQTRRTWAARAGLVASALNLLLIPFVTPFGVYGIVVLSTKAGRDLLRPGPPPMPGQREPGRALEILLQAAVVIAMVPAIDSAVSYLDGRHALTGPAWLILATIPVSLFVPVLIHELGHCLAAWACGFEVVLISVGPLALVHQNQRWQLRWAGRLGAGGLAAIRPKTAHHTREHRMFFAAGGPIASLLSGIVFLIFFLASPGRPWQTLATVVLLLAVISLQAFLITAVPYRGNGYFSDGAHFLQVWRMQPEGLRSIARLNTSLPWNTPLRPRDLAAEAVEAAAAVADGSRDHMAGCFSAYRRCLDRGEIAQAGAWLDEWLALQREHPHGINRDSGLTEVAYFAAAHRFDPGAARQALASARRGLLVERHTIRRAEAAVLIAEGNTAAACQAISEARADLDRRPSTGHIEFERDLLADLEQRAMRKQPEAALPLVTQPVG